MAEVQLQLPDTYRSTFDAMLTAVASDTRLRGRELTVFWPLCGRCFVPGQGLLVIGRAVNGWTTGRWPARAFGDPENRREAIEEVRSRSVASTDCPMSWVGKLAGSAKGDYNTNRSAFWRVARKITASITPDSDNDKWWSHVCWSNLCKVSPWEGGNPSKRLRGAQLKLCVDLLQIELDHFKPSRVLVIAGDAWYRHYLDGLGINLGDRRRGARAVEAVARHRGQHWVFTNRPERRPEKDFVREVVNAFEERTAA